MDLTLDQGPFLILSDLHIGHQSTEIRDVEQLAPLFLAGQTVIFNGDTFEMRTAKNRERAEQDLAALQALLEVRQTAGIFLGGNHDPFVSPINHVEFGEAGIFITHGDVLFSNVAPWSKNAHLYEQACARELSHLPREQRHELIARLGAIRRGTRSYDVRHPPAPQGWIGSLMHLLETSWPPWEPFLIIKTWCEIPALAEKLMAEHRPGLKFLLMGHSHYAGCWQRGELQVINTGALMRLFPRRAVLIERNALSVHRIKRIGWIFSLGELERRFLL